MGRQGHAQDLEHDVVSQRGLTVRLAKRHWKIRQVTNYGSTECLADWLVTWMYSVHIEGPVAVTWDLVGLRHVVDRSIHQSYPLLLYIR